MDVWRIMVAALRRWYVLLPLLALTAVAVMMSGNRAAPEYEAEASAMIAPERRAAEIYNPYGSIAGAQQALSIILNSAEARQTIAEQGLVASYEIGAESRSSILQVAVRSGDPATARDTAQAVIDLAAEELATRQDEADLREASQYTIDVLAAPALVGVVETSQLRVQAVIGALGLAMSVLIAVLFDDILGALRRTRTKRRRRGRVAASDDDHPGQLTLDDIPVVDAPLAVQPASRPEPGVRHPYAPDREQPRRPDRTPSSADQPTHGSLLDQADDRATPLVDRPRQENADTGADPDAEGDAKEAVAAGPRREEQGRSDPPSS